MKCNIQFECTPQEARQFLGLPDLQPMQQRLMEEMERKLLVEMERFSPEGVLKNWTSMMFQTPDQFKDVFNAMLNGVQRAANKS